MKVVIESRVGEDSPRDLTEKLARISSLLENGDPRAASLARVLQPHTPLVYIVSPPAQRVAAWIERFLSFLDDREGEIAVRLLSAEKEGETLLLTNSPDAPYLLESLQNILARHELRFRVVTHPIVCVQRRQGRIVRLEGADGEGSRESFIAIEVLGLPPEGAASLIEEATETIRTALRVHRDRHPLHQRLKNLEEKAELGLYREFWQWLRQGNFLPFSYRCLRVRREEGGITVQEEEETALGLSPDPRDLTCCDVRSLEEFDATFRDRVDRERALVVETIGRRSPIHRNEPLVYLGFREGEGKETVEHAFLGLFSQKSIDELASNIPPLRQRLEHALETLAIPHGSHDRRKAVEIFNIFPKVELFFMEPEELAETVRSFTLLYRQGAIKVVAVRSLAVRGLTMLVVMPREFYAAERMGRLEAYLCRFFRADRADARLIHVSGDYLSLHVTVRPRSDEVRFDVERLERGLTHLGRPWEPMLRNLLARTSGTGEGERLWRFYGGSFSHDYRALIHPRYALRDIRSLERLLASGEEVFDLWGPFRREPLYRLQFYSLRETTLNELMPLLENLHLEVVEEVDFTLAPQGRTVHIKSFALRGGPLGERLWRLRSSLLSALGALRRGEVENDYLNRLLVLTGLSWREIDVFRGYRNYHFQLASPSGKRRVAFALINNPAVALLLFRYFEGRFRPLALGEDFRQRVEETLSPLRLELAQALEQVSDINEDFILRTLFNLIDSTVRTNYFLRCDLPDYFFAFKISAIGIIDMPAPRPLFEIYVHSARTEGIHLRGGKVARGGIRWSDRPDDFRTEVLGLMKTQMTKNALIVPVGSKGAFVVKTPWTDREEGAALARESYRTFMKGLLDLTDNRSGEEIARPPAVLAYDEADPYLVVAADKGTAHLSDTANALSAEYGFWLGDAFASGGSQGYDHKKLGITARGAWECVKRHFREMGRDIQREPFTVVGIGDMSGDVFGNGMLLSRQIHLLAAFDHRHIFLDPDPDPEVSWQERRRLFALPRSSWGDYRAELISAGGGVFARSAKDIPLSPQVRRWLGSRHESIDGPGLIRLLITSSVDLLWNGGVGTYVKASSEKHDEVGDRTNDPVRIDAAELRALVVGEGGNLGFTQRGRIEYALAGGRINTDAVDNSGGVDTSDHEVNLKILMQRLAARGKIQGLEERDRILAEVTEEVASAVLGDNYRQSLCLSLDAIRCSRDPEPFLELADRLAFAGLLDRRGEALPSDREVRSRPERALARPELAILMAYAKMQLYQALLENDLPSSCGAVAFLESYFPAAVRERFGDELASHPLAREIAATVMTNTAIDQAGSAFLHRLAGLTGISLPRGAETYLAFDRVLDGQKMRREIFALDNRLPAELQYACLLELEGVLFSLCLWSLENGVGIGLGRDVVGEWRERATNYLEGVGSLLPEDERRRFEEESLRLEKEGFTPNSARRQAALPYFRDFLPVTVLASATGGELFSVGRTFSEVRAATGIGELLSAMERVQLRDRWDRLTFQDLQKRLQGVAFQLTRRLWDETQGNLETFLSQRRPQMRRLRVLQQQLCQAPPVNFHPFAVLASALEELLPAEK